MLSSVAQLPLQSCRVRDFVSCRVVSSRLVSFVLSRVVLSHLMSSFFLTATGLFPLLALTHAPMAGINNKDAQFFRYLG